MPLSNIDLSSWRQFAKPVTTAEEDAKSKLTLGNLAQQHVEGDVRIQKMQQELEDARKSSKKSVDVARILSEGGDPQSVHQKLMGIGAIKEADDYLQKKQAEAVAVANATKDQQTEYGGLNLSPTPGGAQADTATSVNQPAAPLYSAPIGGVQEPTKVLPLPQTQYPTSTGNIDITPVSVEERMRREFAKMRGEKGIESANRQAEKEAEMRTAAQIKASESVKLGQGDVLVQDGKAVFTNPAAPKNETEYAQQLAAFNANPGAVQQFGSGPLGFLAYQNDLAVKRHRTEAQQTADANSAASEPKEIPTGSPDFKIAQDLAYGKLTFGDFNRMYGTRGSSPGIKKSIYAKAGELNPAFNPAAFEMGYKLASSPKVQQQLASMDNVKEAVPDLLKISDEASRTGITALNKFITAGGIQLGNKKYSNLATARAAFADELSGALGFGAATDMAKQMGFDMTRTDLSPDAFRSGIQDVVMPFIQRKRDTLLKQMGVYGQPGFQPGSEQPNAQPKTMILNGKTLTLGSDGKYH